MEEFLEHARRSYKDLLRPDYSFYADALRVRPYQGLVDGLADLVRVVEDTGVDDDVCFAYVLHGPGAQWYTWISAVGPFAALCRVPLDHRGRAGVIGRTDVVTAGGVRSDLERDLVALMTDAGLRLLSADEMETEVEFNPVDDTGPVPLFRVLFRDDEFVPWTGEVPGAGPG